MLKAHNSNQHRILIVSLSLLNICTMDVGLVTFVTVNMETNVTLSRGPWACDMPERHLDGLAGWA